MKMVTMYRIGYVFDDAEPNWIWHTHSLEQAKELAVEVEEEYGEKPVVQKYRTKA